MDQIPDGTSHMQCAILRIIENIQPEQLKNTVRYAAQTGILTDGNPAKRELWERKALWYRSAAQHLVLDAAETYDRILNDQERKRQQQEIRFQRHNASNQMHKTKETRFHGVHNGQLHATASVLDQSSSSDLSEDDMFDMDHTVEEEAFPTRVLVKMIDSMLTSKREKTIAWLREMANSDIRNNPVIGLLRQIPTREKVWQEKPLTKQERKQQRKLDAIFQQDVVRRVQKWTKAVQAGQQQPKKGNSPSKTSVNTMDDAF